MMNIGWVFSFLHPCWVDARDLVDKERALRLFPSVTSCDVVYTWQGLLPNGAM